MHTWPQTACLADHEADVLWTLFHLAGKIKGCGENEVWVCLSNLIFGIEPLEIHLCCCNGLLSGGHALAKLDELYLPWLALCCIQALDGHHISGTHAG
jgi:hypothetical protein